jgi:hypothetical protein
MSRPTRLSVALDFACAAITVMLSGYIADQVLRDAKDFRPNQPFTKDERREFGRGGIYYGLMARIAGDFDVNYSSVSRVLYGGSTNQRIAKALRIEMKKIGSPRSSIPDKPNYQYFTEEEIKEFCRRGKYNGILKKVKDSLRVPSLGVWRTLHGLSNRPRVRDAIRAEMNKIGPPRLVIPCAEPLSALEKKEFRTGGRYRGLHKILADKTEVNRTYISRIASGKVKSDRILSALREEMARVDFELAAKKAGA